MIVVKKILGGVLGAALTAASPQLGAAIDQAVATAASRPDVPLARSSAEPVAQAIRDAMPADPKALVPLWPQLARYAISWAGLWLAKNGYATESEVEMISGALITIGPPLWLVISTRVAQWRAKA